MLPSTTIFGGLNLTQYIPDITQQSSCDVYVTEQQQTIEICKTPFITARFIQLGPTAIIKHNSTKQVAPNTGHASDSRFRAVLSDIPRNHTQLVPTSFKVTVTGIHIQFENKKL